MVFPAGRHQDHPLGPSLKRLCDGNPTAFYICKEEQWAGNRASNSDHIPIPIVAFAAKAVRDDPGTAYHPGQNWGLSQ